MDFQPISMHDDLRQYAAHEVLTSTFVQPIESTRDEPTIPDRRSVPISVGLSRGEPGAGFVELPLEPRLFGDERSLPSIEGDAIEATLQVQVEKPRAFGRDARDALGKLLRFGACLDALGIDPKPSRLRRRAEHVRIADDGDEIPPERRIERTGGYTDAADRSVVTLEPPGAAIDPPTVLAIPMHPSTAAAADE